MVCEVYLNATGCLNIILMKQENSVGRDGPFRETLNKKENE
jgi:hypothetical protein